MAGIEGPWKDPRNYQLNLNRNPPPPPKPKGDNLWDDINTEEGAQVLKNTISGGDDFGGKVGGLLKGLSAILVASKFGPIPALLSNTFLSPIFDRIFGSGGPSEEDKRKVITQELINQRENALHQGALGRLKKSIEARKMATAMLTPMFAQQRADMQGRAMGYYDAALGGEGMLSPTEKLIKSAQRAEKIDRATASARRGLNLSRRKKLLDDSTEDEDDDYQGRY